MAADLSMLRIPLVFLLLSQLLGIDGFDVVLKMPRFVQIHRSVVLKCDYNLDLDNVYKVEWHKRGRKIFQFIKGRNPPFLNFTVAGATLDLKHSDDKQIRLKHLDLEASDYYACSVTTEIPIYTNPSDDVYLTVYVPQQGNPEIALRKESAYTVGEVLVLNCTSPPALPPPSVRWLVNGEEVSNDVNLERLQSFHQSRHHEGVNLTTSTSQLTLDIADTHVAESGFIELSCISSIPADYNMPYADKRMQNISVEVHKVEPVVEQQSDKSACCPSRPLPELILALAIFLPAYLLNDCYR